MRKQRILISGMGVAGSLIAVGLAARDDVEWICLERAGPEGHADAGTGLNIGPNALKALPRYLPDSAARIVAASLPWERWDIFLTDGRPLMRLGLDEVADNAGVRIRWSALYALLRAPIREHIRFHAELSECGRSPAGIFACWTDVASGERHRLDDIDLLIAADGRYSPVRNFVLGEARAPRFLGVALFRLLFAAGPDCPIDDYGQWFKGPRRLLAYRVPGDLVYCAGSFPIPPDGSIPDEFQTADFLARAYRPERGDFCPEAACLVEAARTHVAELHWSRLQDGEVAYGREPGFLLVGDSAHPMVPTLGQGATQACEDACVVVDEIESALDEGRSLATVCERVERERSERVRFVVEFSREATDTMLEGADPVAGARAKSQAPFREKLARLYRDAPSPRGKMKARAQNLRAIDGD